MGVSFATLIAAARAPVTRLRCHNLVSAFRLALKPPAGVFWAKMKGRVMEWDAEVDCEGLLCPLPVLRARKRLAGMPVGAVLCVRATDAMAAIDLPHFCQQAGHVFLGARQEGPVGIYLIRAGKVPSLP